MNDTVEGLLNDHFDGKKYDTEEEMLKDVDLFVEDLVQDAYRWGRRFKGDPQGNAEDLDIEVEEYKEEDEEDADD